MRKDILKNLATSIILYEKVITSQAKAKEVKPIVEKMISLGRKRDLPSKRRLFSYFPDKNAALKILEDLSLRYKSQSGGFLQIFKIGREQGRSLKKVLVRLLPVKLPKIQKEEVKNEKSRKKND